MDLLLCKNKPSEKTGFITYQKQISEGIEFVIKLPGQTCRCSYF